jgi:hypothetical protein
VFSIKLPTISDADGDSVTVTTDFGSAQSYVTYQDGLLVIEDTSLLKPGFFVAKFVLNDGTAKKSYSTNVLIHEVVAEKEKTKASESEGEEEVQQ